VIIFGDILIRGHNLVIREVNIFWRLIEVGNDLVTGEHELVIVVDNNYICDIGR
jgi:excinuclease UvrABC ATPase subunit